MKTASYMRFVEASDTLLDRVGGLPTHLPPQFPRCGDTGQQMAFLGQFYCDAERLPMRGVLCVQLYQCLHVDDGDDPQPIAIKVPIGAEPNVAKLGLVQPHVVVRGIEWETKLDPDDMPYSPAVSPEVLELYQSKAGGAIPFKDALPPDAKVLFQLTEHPVDFNFGGLTAIVYLDPNEDLQVTLV